MAEKILYIVEVLRDFNIWSVIVRLLLATILSGIIGVEREKVGRAAGLRTHILVCLGATIASMVGLHIDATYGTGDVTRIAAQVVSGIGFLGAGTILVKNKSVVTGLTTAACVWTTGAVGIAVGYGFYEAAIVGALLVFFITGKLGSVDKKLYRNTTRVSVFVEFEDAKFLNASLKNIEAKDITINQISLTKAKTENPKAVGAEMLLKLGKKADVDKIMDEINDLPNVNFAIII